MKKIYTLTIFIFLSFCGFAQKDSIKVARKTTTLAEDGKNEIKINLFTTILGLGEINYERLLNDNSGVGLAFNFAIDDNIDMRLAFIPHYRAYFGGKKANGFFIEANAAVISMRESIYTYYNNGNMNGNFYTTVENKNKSNFGLGAAAGGKFLTKNGLLGEAYLGIGRQFGSNGEFYPRVGISLGKRF